MGKANILIVEDEAIIAADLCGKIIQLGYTVLGTTDRGEDAINRARKHRPDLVLMDISLAGDMDGVEAAEIIRREFDLPVIYLTAHSDSVTLHRAKISEPFGYLLKPFDDLVLETHIEMALYKHQAERKLRQAYDELELRVLERTKELKEAQVMLRESNETLEQRVEERTAELAAANLLLRDSRKAALNMMEDADAARWRAERTSEELQREIAERKRVEGEIRQHVDELERFNKASVGRELRMVQLKKEVNELLHRLGEPPRYSLEFAAEWDENDQAGYLELIRSIEK